MFRDCAWSIHFCLLAALSTSHAGSISNAVEYKSLMALGILSILDNEPSKYFKQMYSLVKDLSLKELSMGMSNDYLQAVENGATYIRIGSKIFGARN